MPDRWKQWRSSQRWDKNDDAIQIEIIRHLVNTTHLEWPSFKREWYLGYYDDPLGVRLFEYITKKQVEAGIRLRNPDISVVDKYGRVAAVIEIDGAIHDIKTAKTAKRNSEYEAMDIPYFVLNLAEISRLGLTCTEYLDKNERFKSLISRIA